MNKKEKVIEMLKLFARFKNFGDVNIHDYAEQIDKLYQPKKPITKESVNNSTNRETSLKEYKPLK